MSHKDGLSSPPGTPQVKCQRDDFFYFENVTLKVGDTLFRVPKSGLNVEGTPFQPMFASPLPTETSGNTDECAIEVNGVSKAEFRGFLRTIYRFSGMPLNYDDLVGALHLATMWGFTELRTHLIRELSLTMHEKPAHEQILVARASKVKQWLLDAYATLVLEPPPLDLTELADKGIDANTIVKLFLVRERRQSEAGTEYTDTLGYNSGCRCTTCHRSRALLHREAVLREVERIFAAELAEMELR